MILRKPYAILIKNFRLIHLILAGMMVYLFYRTNSILSFLNEYIGSSQIKIKDNTLSVLFGNVFFVLVAFIILLTLVIMSLMAFKKKPIKFYIYNIITYVSSVIIYSVAFYTIQKLQYGLLDVKTLKLIQDLTTATLVLQIAAIVIVIIRATGFNIKKFNFNEDLDKIEIQEEDNEEFEVNLDVDTDKLMRKIRKRFRYAKYVYIENKFFINILLVVFVGALSIFIYASRNVYSKTYTKNESFKTVQFILGTSESFKTKYINSTETIEDGYQLIVVRINAKRIYYQKIGLNTGRFTLHANNNLYYHTTEYKDDLIDLGETYMNNIIHNDSFDNYILVFKVKEKDLNNGLLLTYTDLTNDKIRIKLYPNDLNITKDETKVNIQNELKFTNSIFKNSILKIDSYELNDSFKLDYKYCVGEDCYDSVEYINVSATDNYNKTLLKLVGTFKYDESLPITKSDNLFKFINRYGIIKYKIGDTVKSSLVELKEIKPRKTTVENTYFIEVSNVLKNADSIILEFNIRNRIYSYIIK